jgi:hypothetical protein
MDNKAKYTLNVYLATKELVLRLIKTYDYKTVDDCISSICNFIEVNKLNPRAIYAEEDNAIFRSDLRMYFEDLRRFLDSRDQSMRKFWGAMEKSYFKPLLSNLVIKNTIEANDVVPPNAPNNVLKAEPMETEKNTSDIQELRQLNSKIDNLKKANKEINDLYDIYREKLNYLINNVKITSSMTGKDYVEINMSKEEWFKFKNSIPNL